MNKIAGLLLLGVMEACAPPRPNVVAAATTCPTHTNYTKQEMEWCRWGVDTLDIPLLDRSGGDPTPHMHMVTVAQLVDFGNPRTFSSGTDASGTHWVLWSVYPAHHAGFTPQFYYDLMVVNGTDLVSVSREINY